MNYDDETIKNVRDWNRGTSEREQCHCCGHWVNSEELETDQNSGLKMCRDCRNSTGAGKQMAFNPTAIFLRKKI